MNAGIHYYTNGGGRDTYIHNNNGGFNNDYHKPSNHHPKPGTMKQYPTCHEVRQPPNPVIHSKTNFYRSNGGGRDSYVE